MILVAPTAFKGTIGAAAAAEAMAAGIRRVAPDAELRIIPVSDGGPGLLDALAAAWGGTEETLRVTGPLGDAVRARVLRAGEAVVLESAEACGLHLVPPARLDPLAATTRGVGELLRAVSRYPGVANRPARVILGLGGSATVDGGAGMAQALGWRLEDDARRPIPPGGDGLLRLARIRPPETGGRLPPVTALADVANPLLGDAGAAAVFGPQKGADGRGVARLARGLARLAARIEADLGLDVRNLPGAGAAGGLGAAAVAFLGAELVPGGEWLLRTVGFADALARARLVVTGEGSYDAQSGMGKIVGTIVERAAGRRVPVLLVAGRIENGLPDGVTGVDGGGGILDAEALESRVAGAAGRLLSVEGSA